MIQRTYFSLIAIPFLFYPPTTILSIFSRDELEERHEIDGQTRDRQTQKRETDRSPREIEQRQPLPTTKSIRSNPLRRIFGVCLRKVVDDYFRDIFPLSLSLSLSVYSHFPSVERSDPVDSPPRPPSSRRSMECRSEVSAIRGTSGVERQGTPPGRPIGGRWSISQARISAR